MQTTVQELRELVNTYAEKFLAFSDTEFLYKPVPAKWSKQEIVGHLIDSAQNNLRRFIVGQYEEQPPRIVYDQDFWVNANGYQKMKKEDVVGLWRLINERICAVLLNMPADKYGNTCNTDKTSNQLRTLAWLAGDYVSHMKHHINQAIPGSFDIQYK